MVLILVKGILRRGDQRNGWGADRNLFTTSIHRANYNHRTFLYRYATSLVAYSYLTCSARC